MGLCDYYWARALMLVPISLLECWWFGERVAIATLLFCLPDLLMGNALWSSPVVNDPVEFDNLAGARFFASVSFDFKGKASLWPVR
jgi:hypothetical protein